MSLFFAIMVHKSLVMYSAGLNLKARFGGSKLKLLGFIGILALITPLGGIVGFIVEVELILNRLGFDRKINHLISVRKIQPNRKSSSNNGVTLFFHCHVLVFGDF